MNIWKELFGEIGFWVIPLMLISWVASVWYIKREEGKNIKYENFFKSLLPTIQKIRDRTVEIKTLIEAWYYQNKPIGINPTEVIPEEVVTKMRTVRTDFERLRYFFKDKEESKIESLINKMESAIQLLEYRQMIWNGEESGSDEQYEHEQKILTEISNIEAAETIVTKLFQKILEH